VLERAAAGLEAVRDGRFDTGQAPIHFKPPDSPRHLVKIEQPQLGSRALRELLRSPALGKLVGEITGAEWVQVWWVQGLIKPADTDGSGAKVGWHQDRQYWVGWTDDSELFTAWLALSDVKPDCGPMLFVPGSHQWGLLGQGDFFGQALDDLKSGIRLPHGRTWREVAATLPMGGVSLHHQLTFHGSGANVSGRPRRSVAIHLRTERSQMRTPDHWVGRCIHDPDVCPTIFRRES
jgi:ectoine hydroxylase-related dioxygenase (phytanoyl-CoA dioxygenase family)